MVPSHPAAVLSRPSPCRSVRPQYANRSCTGEA
jgi:hypothetical protein